MNKTNTGDKRKEFTVKTREHLESMRAALIHELSSALRAAHSGSNGDSMDSADLASKELEQNMAATLSARERGRIIEIDYALERIDQEIYGLCGTCGFEITELRLQAMPFTRHCRDCQQDQERKAKGRYHGNDSEQGRSQDLDLKFGEDEINQEPIRR